jgi:hypothetical protein
MTNRSNNEARSIAWGGLGAGWRENGKISKSKRRTLALDHDLMNLEMIWEKVRSTRRRDAIYEYLIAVFNIVRRWRRRGRRKTLLRHAQAFACVKEDMKAEIYSVMVKATTYGDVKTISKLTRVLRYCDTFIEKREELREFIRKSGGLNGCAASFTKNLGSPRLKPSR